MEYQPPTLEDPMFQAFKRRFRALGPHLTLVVNRRIRPIDWKPFYEKFGGDAS